MTAQRVLSTISMPAVSLKRKAWVLNVKRPSSYGLPGRDGRAPPHREGHQAEPPDGRGSEHGSCLIRSSCKRLRVSELDQWDTASYFDVGTEN